MIYEEEIEELKNMIAKSNDKNISLSVSFLEDVVKMYEEIHKTTVASEKTKEKDIKKYDERLKDAMRFYLLATQLKYKIRSGWNETHWNVNKERLESVAEHY